MHGFLGNGSDPTGSEATVIEAMISRVIISGYRCFKHLDFEPNPGLNVVVGINESGKSTLLEAVALALTGRSNGRWVGEELNPYWFHRQTVLDFFERRGRGEAVPAPELRIELFLASDNDAFQPLRGVHNTQGLDAPGIQVSAALSPDYHAEFDAYLQNQPPLVLPVEFYEVQWKDFSDAFVTRRPKSLNASIIDSRTIRSTSGIDYHTREMLSAHLDETERVQISLAHRRSRQEITEGTLASINTRIATENAAVHDRSLGLQMDQSARASWETGIVPQVDDIPFAMAGQGQQASIKVALAMSRTAGTANFVLIEEPENHLSHTSLAKLMARIANLAQADQQLFITTHSSYVLNRLGVDSLLLLNGSQISRFANLSPETINYFRRLSGYDTLRLVLAEKVVLVEGPSDAIAFARAFKDTAQETPSQRGIDVLSMNGLAFKRALELCVGIDRDVVALRDNDGIEPDTLRDDLKEFLEPARRQMFIGAVADGATLEPQIVTANDEATLREVLKLTAQMDVQKWMSANKTEAALRTHDSATSISYPRYILHAVAAVS